MSACTAGQTSTWNGRRLFLSAALLSLALLVCLAAFRGQRGSTAATGEATARGWYNRGLRAARAHVLTDAARDFARAFTATRDPDRQAWALYQEAECYAVQPSQHTQARLHLQRLVRDYPRHFLAARASAELERLLGRKPAGPQRPEIDTDCGPECLQYALQHVFSKTETVSQLRKLAGSGQHATTLLGLQRAAQRCGLDAQGLQADTATLRRLECPAILWVRRSHFILLLDTPRSASWPLWQLRVYDPTTFSGSLRGA